MAGYKSWRSSACSAKPHSAREADVSLAELVDWVAGEGKCCPFFDFHIDLEREGRLLCLRLTGKEGIKPLIRSEFQVPTK